MSELAVDLTAVNLNDWVGRSETVSDHITPTPYAALSAMLDRAPERPAVGAELPGLWHWLYFLPLHRQSEIGPDGHARRGGFLPPVPLPRRMWAGSQFQFHAPLRVGDTITRRSTIERVDQKTGRSGALVFVRVRHDIHVGETVDTPAALTEFHDIVYRDAPRPQDVAAPPVAAPLVDAAHGAWSHEWVPDDVLLFRYSALTFNGHRIHYDRRYVTETEGYPGLIVHGPLIATLLVDGLRHQHPLARLSRFEFRAMRPIFDIHRFNICGAPQADGKTFRLWASDHEGALAMDATAVIA